MDDELRQAFATLSGQMSGLASDAAAGHALQKQTIIEVRQLGGRVERLEKHVFGSDPPPPIATSVVTRISHSEGDIAELSGQIIAVKAQNEEQTKKLARLEAKTDAQTQILTRLDAVAANPMVRRVAYAFGVAILGYLATKGYLR